MMNRLPSEIWNHVFTFLPSLDLLRLAGANRYFRGLVYRCYTLRVRPTYDKIETFEDFREIAATHYLSPSNGIVMVPWTSYREEFYLQYIAQRGMVFQSREEYCKSSEDVWEGDVGIGDFPSMPWKEESNREAYYLEEDFPAKPQQSADGTYFYTMVDRSRNAFLLILSNAYEKTYIIAGTLIPKKIFSAFTLLDYYDAGWPEYLTPLRDNTLFHCLVDTVSGKEILGSNDMLNGLPTPSTLHDGIKLDAYHYNSYKKYLGCEISPEEKAAIYKKLEPHRKLLLPKEVVQH